MAKGGYGGKARPGMHRVNVPLPTRLIQHLRTYATENGMTLEAAILRACRELVEREGEAAASEDSGGGS